MRVVCLAVSNSRFVLYSETDPLPTRGMCCFSVIAALNGLVRGAAADGFFGEEGLLAEAVGDFGEFAFVDADGGEVVHLADEKQGA